MITSDEMLLQLEKAFYWCKQNMAEIGFTRFGNMYLDIGGPDGKKYFFNPKNQNADAMSMFLTIVKLAQKEMEQA